MSIIECVIVVTEKEMNIHELRLGVNNSTTSICICEECLLIFNDLLNEYTDKLGG